MAEKVEVFKEQFPSLDSYWRSIILFGQNTASFKFALAETLLELTPKSKTEFFLEELAGPFSKNICRHLEIAPKQTSSPSSSSLDKCKEFNEGVISYDELVKTTMSTAFRYVIDAFHVVNHEDIPIRFFEKDYSNQSKKIVLTDELFKLKEMPFSENFNNETESRWNLVETAWELGISKNLLNVRYDDAEEIFFVDKEHRRKDVTSARGALDGYQKGKCFYCFDGISIQEENITCDVDHFFPYTLQKVMPDVNLNGVWNLVLSCQDCNRGSGGKFALVPSVKYLERLHRRNEYLISSHHPLRETIINQTGATEHDRANFLRMVDQRAIDILIHRWEVPEKAEPTF